MATYDLAYPGAAIDAILNTAYFLQEAGYIFQGSASEYSGTPSKRVWLIAPAGFTGLGIPSAVPHGSFGICLYNGTAWVGKVINVLTLDSEPTRNSQNGVTSGGVAATLDEIAGGIMETFASLLFDDETAVGDLRTKLSYAVKFSVSDVYQTVTHLNILAATSSKAGLMSAEDKAKVDSFLANLRSLTFTDTTASVDQGTQITETLKATIGGVQEVIDSITLLAATSSKAGLLSAADKAYIDALPATLTNLSNSISGALALMQSLVGYYVCDTAAGTAAKTVDATGYSLTNGGCIRIKMTNANTADNVTLNINSTGAKALYYDGAQASSSNSWDAGDILEVFYDGTQYQCASGGGGKFATGESVKDVSLLDSVNNSSNIPKSSAVKEYVDNNLGTGISSVSNILLPWVKGVVNNDGKTVTASNSAIYILLYDISGATSIEVTQTSSTNDTLYILNDLEQVIHSVKGYNGVVHLDFANYEGAKYVSLSLNSGNNRSFNLIYAQSIQNVLQKHSEEIDDLNDVVFESSLVDVTYDETQVQNGYLNYGGFVSNGSCRLTPLIPVLGGETIYITGVDINNGMPYASVSCYDAEQNFLQPIEAGTNVPYIDKPVTIPSNVRYIRVCSRDANPVIKQDSEPSDKFSGFQSQIDDTNTRIDDLIPYTFYPTDIPFTIELTGYRFLATNLSAAEGYLVTNYIPVIEGKKLHIVAGGEGNSQYYNGVWYNAGKIAVSALTQKGLTLWNSYEIEVPTGAKYLRLCSKMSETIRLYYIHDKTTAEELMDSFYKAVSVEILNGAWATDGSVLYGSDQRYKRCSLVVHKGDKFKFKVHDYAGSVGAGSFMLYNSQTGVYTNGGSSVCCIPELLTVPYDGVLYLAGTNYNNSPRTSFEVFKYDTSGSGGGKKSFPRAIHTCGHSFWNGDGLSYTQFGQTKTRKGYQSYFKDFYDFPSFDDLKYDGHSLGAQSASDTYSIALKLSSWQGGEGDLWCLDTITNDFKRNIPLGTLDDYNAAEPSALTYYGALRIFRNKIVELCGSTVAVVLSNATHRNNGNYTSTSTNSVGCKLIDYSNAAMCIAEIEGWNFVDVFNYGGIFDDNLAVTTIDGLHPNNLGYKLSVKPWLEQLGILFELL